VLAPQRHAHILNRLQTDGAVRVADLVREFGVSDMTVRRDLEVLETQGHLLKVHGGAVVLRDSTAHEKAFEIKRGLLHEAKLAIARAAVALVQPGMAVAISAGSTTYEVARGLTAVPRLTVITNSVPAAEALYHHGRADQTVILTGGVRTPSDALVGPFAVAALRSVNVDIVFLGIHGMTERAGFTTPNLMEAETHQSLVGSGGRVVVTADHTKWGISGLSTICPLSGADSVIADTGLDPGAQAVLRAEVGELILADAARPAADDARPEGPVLARVD